MFNQVLKEEGAKIYSSSIDFIKKLKKAGIKIGLASSSKNCKAIIESAKISKLFETRVDGVVSAELGLKGKPESDIFVRAAENIGSFPVSSVVVEDATSGVLAGRNGGFGLVLGVARKNNETELLENGADIVVRDLADITIEVIQNWFNKTPKPLFDSWDASIKKDKIFILPKNCSININPCFSRSAKTAIMGKEKIVFFLDYDGTLTPIVERPELAVLTDQMREVVTNLSKKHMVAIVSGRMREDVENLVKIDNLFYAGSHGFDIRGPGFSMVQPKAKEVIPVVSKVIDQLKKDLKDIEGVIIEEKKFSVAVHYRLVDKKHLDRIRKRVDQVIKENDSLRLMCGKMVYEILPNIDWNKGKAIRWIMQALDLSWGVNSVIYIGDDTTDEFAFRAIRTRGTAILVSKDLKASASDFHLSSTDQVKELFEKIITTI